MIECKNLSSHFNEDTLKTIESLLSSFPKSLITYDYKVMIDMSNVFLLKDCQSPNEIKCKVLEYLSRWFSRVKEQPFRDEETNKKYRVHILQGINNFLGTHFSEDEMRKIYNCLGYNCNHQKTLDFINSNYNMETLQYNKKKIKDIKEGEIFIYADYEWIKLKGGLSITSNIVDTMFFDSCAGVFYDSDISFYLTNEFINKLLENGANLADFEEFKLDLTGDDGTKKHNCTVKIGLLSADIYRKNRELIDPICNDWWLVTPKSYTSDSDSDNTVIYVNTDGVLNSISPTIELGVRPVCRFADNMVVDTFD